MEIKRFEDLEVWQLSRVLVKDVYLLTRSGNMVKDLGFCNQMQRSALSIMNNIAEGFERKSSKEFVQFLFIAKSSCGEVRSMIYVALDIGYIDNGSFSKLLKQTETISKSLSGFIKYLKSRKMED